MPRHVRDPMLRSRDGYSTPRRARRLVAVPSAFELSGFSQASCAAHTGIPSGRHTMVDKAARVIDGRTADIADKRHLASRWLSRSEKPTLRGTRTSPEGAETSVWHSLKSLNVIKYVSTSGRCRGRGRGILGILICSHVTRQSHVRRVVASSRPGHRPHPLHPTFLRRP